MSVALHAPDISRALIRISHEILEANPDSSKITLLGIPTRGAHLALRIAAIMGEIAAHKIPVGMLDITCIEMIFECDCLEQLCQPRFLLKASMDES